MKKITKKSLTEECRNIIKRYKASEVISDKSDIEFLLNILLHHPEAELKIGSGLDYFTTEFDDFGNRCFYIHRTDKTCTDFSFGSCIKNYNNTNPDKRKDMIENIQKACRYSVKHIIIDFINTNLNNETVCSISNIKLSKSNKDYHVDHFNMSFIELVFYWLADKDIEEIYSKINLTEDNNLNTYFICPETEGSFIRFHNANTNLRFLHTSENLKLPKIKFSDLEKLNKK